VEGIYPLPALGSFSREDQLFIHQFIKASGSLKEMAKLTKVSYPTVRNKLNEIIDKLSVAELENRESS
jgi:hypothetical protein